MQKPKFDKLLSYFVDPGITPEQMLERFTPRALDRLTWGDKNPYKRWATDLKAFRKLGKPVRLRFIKDYLTREPPQPSFSEAERVYKRKYPIFQALLRDENAPCSSYYDIQPNEYVAIQGESDQLFWKTSNPLLQIKYVPYVFKTIEVIPRALIKLATQLKRAFRVTLKSLDQTRKRFPLVLMPVGDKRAEKLASSPENAHEVPGVPLGTALLFESGEQENNGLIAEYCINGPRNNPEEHHFGVVVWGSFYAIELDTIEFEDEPKILIG